MSDQQKVKTLSISDATHWLECVHSFGIRMQIYHMRCLILKEMPGTRVKLLVFGERNWKDRNDIKKIRYVEKNRLSAIKD